MPKTPEERRAYDKIYYARNREKLKARQAAYRAANPAKYREQEKRYRQQHPEKLIAQRASPERQAYKAAWWEKNRNIRRQKDREKYAENRLDIRKKRKEAYAKNPEPSRTYGALYRQKNREKVRAQNAAYAKNHPEILAAREARRRARKNSAPVNDLTAAQWKSIKEHYGHCCVYCGRHMERLTQDHIIPISQGGSHTVQNVVPACMTFDVLPALKDGDSRNGLSRPRGRHDAATETRPYSRPRISYDSEPQSLAQRQKLSESNICRECTTSDMLNNCAPLKMCCTVHCGIPFTSDPLSDNQQSILKEQTSTISVSRHNSVLL